MTGPNPEVRLLIADTRSGKVQFEVPHTSRSWSQKINADGSAGAKFPIQDTLEAIYEQGTREPGALLREVLSGPYRYCLGVVYGRAAIWGGPLLPATSLTSRTEVEVRASEIGAVLAKRKLVNRAGTGSLTDASRDLIFERVNQRELAYRVVMHAIGGGTGYELPIYCSDPPAPTGVDAITYFAYDVASMNARKALAAIAKGPEGPDIRFDAQLVERSDGDYLIYDLRVGDPYLDHSTLWTWDESMIKLDHAADGVGMATTMYLDGSGQDRDKIVGRAVDDRLIAFGWPVLEDSTSTLQNADQAGVDSAAAAAVAASSTPTVSWSLEVAADSTPQLGTYRVGELGRVDVRRHPLIPPGVHDQRIVAMSGDDSDKVKITLGVDDDQPDGA